MAAQIRVGTSGWQYDHWRGPFYPEDLPKRSFLEHYARELAFTEVNSFFYGLPKPDTVTGWREAVPEAFLFAVKASRYITHMKKLKDPHASLERFWERARLLGDQLGPVLFQLPPNWRVNTQRLADFLAALPAGPRYTFEFRDPSWFCDEVYTLLEEANAAFCVYELGDQNSPVRVTADFAYVRLHGPEAAYAGEYGEAGLAPWRDRLSEWREAGIDSYCLFDNDEAGYAVRDALRLRSMLGKEGDAHGG